MIKYIHQNPEKANIVNKLTDYKWSSYNAYIAELSDDLVDINFILDAFYENRKLAVKQFVESHEIFEVEEFELSDNKRMDDSQIKRMILKISGVENLSDISKLEKSNRNNIICELHKEGVSIREIERFTGISRGGVYRIIKKA